jgi:hypothetical protein
MIETPPYNTNQRNQQDPSPPEYRAMHPDAIQTAASSLMPYHGNMTMRHRQFRTLVFYIREAEASIIGTRYHLNPLPIQGHQKLLALEARFAKCP